MRIEPNKFELRWLDLASKKLGGKVLYATDDFFAEKENLIKPSQPIFLPDEYTENGKWMDGWESRRKRSEGYDHAIIELGLCGSIQGLNIDTAFFTGNHPPRASVDACYLEKGGDLANANWSELLAKSHLGPGQANLFDCNSGGPVTHLRLNIYPDGGVARLRAYGRAQTAKDKSIDLASAANGALVLSCSDMYFSPKDNLIMPFASSGMHDGWETRRKREPGNDWSIVALAGKGKIEKVEIDTAFFKGNFPDSASLEGCEFTDDGDFSKAEWKTIVPQTKLKADQKHYFEGDRVQDIGATTHLRLNIFPDGGVARLRCFGQVL